jgi:hypothetical protein
MAEHWVAQQIIDVAPPLQQPCTWAETVHCKRADRRAGGQHTEGLCCLARD